MSATIGNTRHRRIPACQPSDRREPTRPVGSRRTRARCIIVVLAVGVLVQAGLAQALTVATNPIAFPAVTLDGTDQMLDGSTSAWRADATGETGGWNLTVASTDFSAGSEVIPVSQFSIRLLDTDIALVSGDPNGPVSTQTTFGSPSGTPLKIASAAVGDGDGVYDVAPGFRLVVPAATYTGNYTATVTVDIATGP